jgi:DNA-directed RNA polymerase subunit RPC12/RpoP
MGYMNNPQGDNMDNSKNTEMPPPTKYAPKQQQDPPPTVQEEVVAILQHVTAIENEIQEVKGKLHGLCDLEETPSSVRKTPHVPTSEANRKGDNGDKENEEVGGDKEERGEEEDEADKKDKKVKRKFCHTCRNKMEADAKSNYVNCETCRDKATIRWKASKLKREAEKERKKEERKQLKK